MQNLRFGGFHLPGRIVQTVPEWPAECSDFAWFSNVLEKLMMKMNSMFDCMFMGVFFDG